MFIDRMRQISENIVIEKIDGEVLDSIKRCAKKGWFGLIVYKYKNQKLYDLYKKDLESLSDLGFYTYNGKDMNDRYYVKVEWTRDRNINKK